MQVCHSTCICLILVVAAGSMTIGIVMNDVKAAQKSLRNILEEAHLEVKVRCQ